MLHDELHAATGGVDRDSAHEFLKEATKLASSGELYDISARLADKSRLFQRHLAPEALERLDGEAMEALGRTIFLMRRQTRRLLHRVPAGTLRVAVADLLYGEAPLGGRFERFVAQMAPLQDITAISLASELLYYTFPDRYWLWTVWLWDPRNGGGALPLVLNDGSERLHGAGLGETYQRVGGAMEEVAHLGDSEGFTRLGPGPFGATVFLACVYAVYMYTVFRMKLSNEFNRILPELPEFTRRLLGVYRLDGRTRHG